MHSYYNHSFVNMKWNLGISPHKYVSIAFLLGTIIIALILSGLPDFHSILVSDHLAAIKFHDGEILENMTTNTVPGLVQKKRQEDIKKAEAILKDAVKAKQDKMKNKDIIKAEKLLKDASSKHTMDQNVHSKMTEPRMMNFRREINKVPNAKMGARMGREHFDTLESTKTMPLHIPPRPEIVQDIMRQQMNASEPIPLERQINKSKPATQVFDQVFGLMEHGETFDPLPLRT